MGRHEDDDRIAKAVGYSRSTMQRLAYLREVAEEEGYPDVVRKFAADLHQRAGAGYRGVWPAYQKLRALMVKYELDVWENECQTCGKTFAYRRPEARYCSNACRQRAYRDRGGV